MIRYVISPIVGTGTEEDPYRASVTDVPTVNSSSIIPSFTDGPNIGQPKYRFAFSMVATSSVSAIAAVTNAYVFPDYVLDGQMGGMEAQARLAFKQSVEAYDLDGNGLHFDASNVDLESWRDVINRVVRQIEPAFNVHFLNVGEVAS